MARDGCEECIVSLAADAGETGVRAAIERIGYRVSR